MAAKKTQRTLRSEKLPRSRWSPVGKLRPRPNARTHTPEQIQLIADSIVEYGWTNPLLVDEKGSILAGHGRWEAAKGLGLKRVPVIPKEGLTSAQKRAYVIADNRLAELAGWDPMMLAAELGALAEIGYDLGAIGFDPDAVKDALARAGRRMNATTDPDSVPGLPDVVTTEPGDVWLLGPHRVSSGDATKPEDVARLLDGARPDLCVTDPPYGVDYDPEWRVKAAEAGHLDFAPTRRVEVANDDRVDWSAAWRLCPGAVLYGWTGGGDVSIESGQALEAAGFAIRSQLIWRKPRIIISRGHYNYQHESCWYAVRKGGKAGWTGAKNATSVWEVPYDKNVEGGHSTQKPVELWRIALDNHRGDLYEPFLGSGSGLIGAEITGKACYGLELLPVFVDVAVRRWEAFVGAEATLEETGETFAALAERRADGVS